MSTNFEQIIPVVLAAGSSKHLSFPKPLASFGGKTALQLAVNNCDGVGPTIVVLGCDSEKIRPEVPSGAQVICNPAWRNGQQSSLRCALEHIPQHSAFMIYPVDHPLLRKATVQGLVRAFHKRCTSKQIVMPRHNNRLGHPIIAAAALRDEFFTAETAREIVYRDARRNLVIQVRTSAVYQDFDTLASYRNCLRQFLAGR